VLKLFRKSHRIYRQSKEAKILTENFISLSALKLISYIFPLITLPYLAKVIGVDKFGEIAFAASIIIYFQTIVEYGFNYTAVRDIARCKSDPDSISRIFSTVMFSKIILMIFSFILLLILIYFIPVFYNNRLLLLLTFFYIPGYIIFPEWFFQAMEEMKYITFLNLLAQLLFTVLVFIVIKEKNDFIFQPVLIATGFLVSGIISIIVIRFKYHVKVFIPSTTDIIKTLKNGWNMFVCLFLPNLYTSFSIILLKIYFGATATGLYSGGSKFLELADQLSMVLSRTFYPYLARKLDKHKIYVMISFVFSILTSLGLYLGADFLIKMFYTPDFSESAKIIKIMSISPFFLFLINTYGPNYLVLIGKENVLRNIIIMCSISGFCLSLIFVPKFSFIGVAITITLVWGIRGFLTWLYARKYQNLHE
jgi:O-antigen/teichoic acid export membrane protein